MTCWVAWVEGDREGEPYLECFAREEAAQAFVEGWVSSARHPVCEWRGGLFVSVTTREGEVKATVGGYCHRQVQR